MTISEKDITHEILESFSTAKFGEAISFREEAFEELKKTGLPAKKSEEYRFTPITAALQKSFQWKNRISESKINSIEKFLIPHLDANVLVFVNGTFSQKLSSIISPPEQLKIKTLFDAFQTERSSIALYFDKLAKHSADPFAQLNSAFWQEGIFIEVPENTSVEKPLHLLHISDGETEQVITHNRLLALVNSSSKVSIVESFHSTGSNAVFNTFSEEIFVEENAGLHYCKIQNENSNTVQVTNTFIQQVSSSRVDTFTLTLDGTLIRNNLNIAVDGEKCESHFHGLYMLKGNTLADNHTVVDHKKPNSFSNEMYKGVIGDHAKGVFNGKIFVRPHAQKTNAFQSNRNILLDETATINTKPQLEIWADDVKCSHGCTTGQLDDEALFYLRSRGIPQAEAKALLLHAFASETYSNVENESLKNFIQHLISQRLNIN